MSYQGVYSSGYPQGWSTYAQAYAYSLGVNASLVVDSQNPEYTEIDFYKWYPFFQGLVEPDIVKSFIKVANGTVNVGRWFDSWIMGMGLLTAHYCTLFLQTQPSGEIPETGATIKQVLDASRVSGMVASESAGDLSVSYDNTRANSVAADWGDLGLTSYGATFAIMASRLAPAFFVVP